MKLFKLYRASWEYLDLTYLGHLDLSSLSHIEHIDLSDLSDIEYSDLTRLSDLEHTSSQKHAIKILQSNMQSETSSQNPAIRTIQ